MERIFDTFREASQAAAKLCREHAIGASLEQRGDSWAVVFDWDDPSAQEPSASERSAITLENHALRSELEEIQRNVELQKARSESLSARIQALELEISLVKPLLARQVASPFLQSILDKLPKENAQAIQRYEYLCILHELGEIDEHEFDEFRRKSGLWIALYNYNKIKVGPQPLHIPDHPKQHVSICASCGRAVVNGRCRCSE